MEDELKQPQSAQRHPRLEAVDLTRGLAVLFMIMVHTLMVYGAPATAHSAFGVGVDFLGGPPAAPVFMLLMGLAFAYSRRNDLRGGLLRSAKLFVLGYVLNLLRGVVPLGLAGAVAPDVVAGALPAGITLLDVFLIDDILQFAGIALAVMTLLRACGTGRYTLLLIAMVIAMGSPFLWGIKSGLRPLDRVLDMFWGDRPLGGFIENAVSFPVFPWMVFPLVGSFLGDVLRESKDQRAAYRRIGLTGLLVAVVGLGIAQTAPDYHWNDYYHSRQGAMLFFTGFVMAWLSLWDILARRVPDNPLFILLRRWSQQVTVIYLAQWIMIVWGIAVFGSGRYSTWGVLALGVLFGGLSTGVSLLVGRIRKVRSPG
jgi:uncharacterized membrane protein